MNTFLDGLKYNNQGLIPCIVQASESLEILMMAWMNRESIKRTLETGSTCFWSRSRQEFWVKGATSGNTQKVVEMLFDCDADTLIVKVEQKGGACHTGKRSCFYRKIDNNGEVTEFM